MDNKEAIEHIKDVMCSLKTRHMLLDLDDKVTPEDRQTYKKQFKSLQIALSALDNIDNIRVERDAAIADLHECETVNMSCFYCKHYENCRDSKDVLKNKDGTPCNQGIDLWEWRGIQDG